VSSERIIELSLHEENVTTIWSVLESFTMIENINGARCSSCSQKEVMKKWYILYKKPSIAALYLKRFKRYKHNIHLNIFKCNAVIEDTL
jgi:ubiquitin C-terminal hydrolase